MATSNTKNTTTKTATKTAINKNEELVSFYIPLVDGEEDELTVGCNGKMYKIKKGEDVMIPRKLAIIIKNSNAQAREMRKYSDSVKSQELNA